MPPTPNQDTSDKKRKVPLLNFDSSPVRADQSLHDDWWIVDASLAMSTKPL